MRVFLGFGHAQVFVLQLGEDVGQDVLQFLGREEIAQPRPGLFVLRHADEGEIFRARGIGEFLEARLDQRTRHLPGAIGAEIEEDHGIVVANQAARNGGLSGAAAVVITAGTTNSSVTPFS